MGINRNNVNVFIVGLCIVSHHVSVDYLSFKRFGRLAPAAERHKKRSAVLLYTYVHTEYGPFPLPANVQGLDLDILVGLVGLDAFLMVFDPQRARGYFPGESYLDFVITNEIRNGQQLPVVPDPDIVRDGLR